MTRTRFVLGWVLVLALAAALWWGVHPPRTEAAYRRESATVTERLASHLRTAEIWLQTYEVGDATARATSVALAETESDARRDTSSYASYQPPNAEAAGIRSRTNALADQAVTMLGDVRIDARAGRWAAATAVADDLGRLSVRLLDLSREVDR